MKVCSRCRTSKEESEFSGDCFYCKPCNSQVTMAQAKSSPDQLAKHRRRCKKYRLRRRYGITLEQFEKQYEDQEGRCAICGRLPGKKDLGQDHDPANGKNRALLCQFCNTALGSFCDSIEILEKALQYLKDWRIKHGADQSSKSS